MFRFTFKTDAKINLIKALRSAAASGTAGAPYWSLLFTKNAVEKGIITETPLETCEVLKIIAMAKIELQREPYSVNHTFTWDVESLVPQDSVFFRDANNS